MTSFLNTDIFCSLVDEKKMPSYTSFVSDMLSLN